MVVLWQRTQPSVIDLGPAVVYQKRLGSSSRWLPMAGSWIAGSNPRRLQKGTLLKESE